MKQRIFTRKRRVDPEKRLSSMENTLGVSEKKEGGQKGVKRNAKD